MIVIASSNLKLVNRWSRILRRRYPVYTVAQKTALRRAVSSLKPRVLVLDVALPRLRVLRELPDIQGLSPLTKIITLSTSPTTSQGISVLKAGAKGYCEPEMTVSLLEKAVRTVLRNEIWAGRKLLAEFVAHINADNQRRASPPRLRGRLHVLTPRKRQVAILVIDGATNKEIANRLSISEAAVKAHLTGIFRQLNVSRRHALVRLFESPAISGPA